MHKYSIIEIFYSTEKHKRRTKQKIKIIQFHFLSNFKFQSMSEKIQTEIAKPSRFCIETDTMLKLQQNARNYLITAFRQVSVWGEKHEKPFNWASKKLSRKNKLQEILCNVKGHEIVENNFSFSGWKRDWR